LRSEGKLTRSEEKRVKRERRDKNVGGKNQHDWVKSEKIRTKKKDKTPRGGGGWV